MFRSSQRSDVLLRETGHVSVRGRSCFALQVAFVVGLGFLQPFHLFTTLKTPLPKPCLCSPQASHAATTAFRSLCNRCTAKLRSPTTLLALIEAAEGVVSPGDASPSPLSIDERRAVVEGLARIVAALPPADASAAGLRLAIPFIQRVQHMLTVSDGAPSYRPLL